MSPLPYVWVASGFEVDEFLVRGQHAIVSAHNLRSRYAWLVSIGASDSEPPEAFECFPEGQRLRLNFDDVEWQSGERYGYRLFSEEDAAQVVSFGRSAMGPGIVHCAQGMSRSPAVAYILLCAHLGPGREKQAAMTLIESLQKAETLRLRAAGCRPNRRIVHMGAKALAQAPLGSHAKQHVYADRRHHVLSEFYAVFINYIDQYTEL